MSSLTVTYEHSLDDDFGRLRLALETRDFTGRGGFWVQWQDVEEFAESLSVYPLPSANPPRAQWGFEKLEGDDLIIGLELKPADTRGTLLVSVELADDFEPRRRVRSDFTTHYPQLEAFQQALMKLMRREAQEAVLSGE